MLQFQYGILFWLLLLLLPLTVAFILYLFNRRRKLQRFADAGLLKAITAGSSVFKPALKFAILFFAFAVFVAGMANLQLGSKTEKVKRKGVDVMIAFDVSNSMLCEDVLPSRLLRAKQFVVEFIDQLQNDRLGLVVFAGNAYVQMPLTVDYSAARMYIKDINPGMIPTQGTAIDDAVAKALDCFPKGEKKYKSLIVITDGEENEGSSITAVRNAYQQGVVTHVIGVGTTQGGPIPIKNEYNTQQYKTDNEGNIVRTKRNSGMVKQLADEGHGKSFVLNDTKKVVKELNAELDKMDAKTFEEQVFTDYENYFQWFLALAFVLLVVEFAISHRSSPWMQKLNPFK